MDGWAGEGKQVYWSGWGLCGQTMGPSKESGLDPIDWWFSIFFFLTPFLSVTLSLLAVGFFLETKS